MARDTAKGILGLIIIGGVVYGWWNQRGEERAAVEAGFADAKDQKAAIDAGYHDAPSWQIQKKIDEERAKYEAAQATEQEAAQQAQEAAQQARCPSDLQCWADKNMTEAQVQCTHPIELLAKYDFEWQKGWLFKGAWFSKIGWADEEHVKVRYVGDALKLQNGFGAWQVHTYQCVFDPGNPTAVSVSIEPGRLAE